MICPHGHTWSSAIAGVDWDGAIYIDKFCPQCTRAGKRIPFTSADLAGVITDQQLAEAGEDAHQTLALLLAAIITNSDPTVRLNIKGIAMRVFDHKAKVEGVINRLVHLGFIKRTATVDDDWSIYELGPAVHLVRLAES